MMPATAEGARGRILIVEDDLEVQKSLCRILEWKGFSVVGATGDGGEAVTLSGYLTPDVILMDLRLPTLDGIEASRRIRADLPHVQVVMYSAYDDPGLHQDAEDAGVYCYLVKGCPPAMIDDILSRACSRKRELERRNGS